MCNERVHAKDSLLFTPSAFRLRTLWGLETFVFLPVVIGLIIFINATCAPPDGACAHYVMVSKFQSGKPLWLATQRDPQNDWTATQNRVNYDVFAPAPLPPTNAHMHVCLSLLTDTSTIFKSSKTSYKNGTFCIHFSLHNRVFFLFNSGKSMETRVFFSNFRISSMRTLFRSGWVGGLGPAQEKSSYVLLLCFLQA